MAGARQLQDQEVTGPARPRRSLDNDRVAGFVNKPLHALPEDEVDSGRPTGLRANPGRECGEPRRNGRPSGRTETGRGANFEGPKDDAQHDRPTGRFWTGEPIRVSRHLTRTARSQAARHAGAAVCDDEVAVVRAESSVPGDLRIEREHGRWFRVVSAWKEGPPDFGQQGRDQESESGVAAGAVIDDPCCRRRDRLRSQVKHGLVPLPEWGVTTR